MERTRSIISIYIIVLLIQLTASCTGSSKSDEDSVDNSNNVSFVVNNNDPVSFGNNLNEQSLIAAQYTANWLESMASYGNNNTISWPVSNLDSYVAIGYDRGISGIGLFFLRFYQTTGDQHYLQLAMGGANYLSQHIEGRSTFNHDWYGGYAGVGEFLLLMYEETADTSYLNSAVKIGDWLVNNSLAGESGGVYWLHEPNFPKTYTGIAHGNGGAGKFLTRLYRATQNYDYLYTSTEAYDWLQNYKVEIGTSGVAWKRLANDNFYYNGWCSGAAGMLPFFFELADITLDTKYSNEIRAIGFGLLEASDPRSHGRAWKRDMGEGQQYYTTYCQGAAGLVDSLFSLYPMENDQAYLDYAEEGLSWLKQESITHTNGGIYWPVSQGYRRVDTGYQMGVASVARAFIAGFKATGKQEYLETVRSASELLLRIANRPQSNQLNWYKEVEQTSVSETYYEINTSWSNGAAGIGMYWLEVYEITKDLK